MFRCSAAGPPLRSRIRLAFAAIGLAASGCGLITPANYIAQARIEEPVTPICYRQASRIVRRCDRVAYVSDDDVRALLTPSNALHRPGAVR
jgi:hypothetical protein